MKTGTHDQESGSLVVYVPRWRLFAYRAAGWTMSGALDGDFIPVKWPARGKPVFPPAGATAIDALRASQEVGDQLKRGRATPSKAASDMPANNAARAGADAAAEGASVSGVAPQSGRAFDSPTRLFWLDRARRVGDPRADQRMTERSAARTTDPVEPPAFRNPDGAPRADVDQADFDDGVMPHPFGEGWTPAEERLDAPAPDADSANVSAENVVEPMAAISGELAEKLAFFLDGAGASGSQGAFAPISNGADRTAPGTRALPSVPSSPKAPNADPPPSQTGLCDRVVSAPTERDALPVVIGDGPLVGSVRAAPEEIDASVDGAPPSAERLILKGVDWISLLIPADAAPSAATATAAQDTPDISLVPPVFSGP